MPKMKVDREDQFIDMDFARLGLEDFFSQSKSRAIRFFSSGEPTLAFTHMRDIWTIAHSMAGNSLLTEIETNGYFNGNIADWIEGHANIIWISYDGPPGIQDKQRPTAGNGLSSAIILRNIKRFADSKGPQLGIRATISQDNLDKQVELIEYLHDLGVKYVSASPMYYSKVNPSAETASLTEFAKHFVPAFYRAKELGMFYQTLMIVNFDEEVDFYCQATIPTPRLTSDGFVSSCDWASFGARYLPDKVQQELVYGYYDKHANKIVYDHEKIDKIRMRNASYLSRTSCKDCKVLRHCSGGCVGKMIAATGDFFKASDEWCSAVRYLYDNLIIDGLFPFIHP